MPPEKNESSPSRFPNVVFYEIFVRSFADSDGDGIGDLNGITAKLDYLQNLGIEALWLMPINPSPSYHKYDVTDYKAIHPDYGTMEDFKNLLAEAHKRGIRVVIDLVINHTSDQHPWFLEAKKGPDNPYRDYYVWADYDSIADQIAKKEITLDSDNVTQWHAPDGDKTQDHYYGFFVGQMPDLNYDNPKVREEMFEIGRFWLQEIGVDGFRLDAAKHIYPDDRAEDNHQWWVAFRKQMETYRPDVLLVGEVWSDAATVAPYLKGLHSIFNFDLAYAIVGAVKTGKSDQLLEKYEAIASYYRQQNPQYVDATFLSNHDQERFMSTLGESKAKARLAASILLTLPGTPFLYYGEELGTPGKKPDPDLREPMLWDKPGTDPMIPTWRQAKYATPANMATAKEQQADSASLLNFYTRLIGLRKKTPALYQGNLRPVATAKEQTLAFYREQQEERLLVLHNLSDSVQTVSLPKEAGLSAPSASNLIFQSVQGIDYSGQEVRLPAHASAIWSVGK